MKIAAFSDCHEQFKAIKFPKDFDLLICAGDFTYRGDYFAIRDFLEELRALEKPTIIVAGNHELTLDKINSSENQLINIYCRPEANQFYLKNQGIDFLGYKIWGSPYTPWFHDWAFNAPRDNIQEHWDKIPLDTEILVLHGPPYGILDYTDTGNNVGCEALLSTIKTKLKKLKVCIFGHIHESYGQVEIDGVRYYNVSICNRNYKPVNPATIIEV